MTLPANHVTGEHAHPDGHNVIEAALNDLVNQLTGKASTSALNAKANATDVTTALAAKADASTVAGFATTSALTSGLAGKVATNDGRLADARTPTNNSVDTSKLVDGAVTKAKTDTSVQASLTAADNALPVAEHVNFINGAGTTETLPPPTTQTINRLVLNSATCAITLPAPVAGAAISLTLKQDATGGRGYSLVGTYVAEGGVLPAITQTANAATRLSLVCEDITEGWIVTGPSSFAIDPLFFFPNSVFASGGESAMSMIEAKENGVSVGSGVIKLMYFTAKRSEAITRLNAHIGSSAYTSPTHLWLAVFSIDSSGNGTQVAITSDSTTGMTSTDSDLTRTLTTTWNKQQGQRYALAYLAVADSAASMVGSFLGATANANVSGTRIVGNLSGTTIPSSFAVGDPTATLSCVQITGLP